MMWSSVRVKYMDAQSGMSPKLLAAFVVFMAGSELFQSYTESSRWLASIVGLGLWSVVMYTVPPRPKLWKLLLATASLALIVLALHLLHVG
jgi:hypothetical protein